MFTNGMKSNCSEMCKQVPRNTKGNFGGLSSPCMYLSFLVLFFGFFDRKFHNPRSMLLSVDKDNGEQLLFHLTIIRMLK